MMKKLRPASVFLHTAPQVAAFEAILDEQRRLLGLIQKHLPENLQNRCLSAQRKGDGLLIYTESSAWASRLRYFSNDLRRKLREEGFHFGKINVRVFLAERRKLRPARHTAPLSADNARLIRAVADGIQDPDLRAALDRLSQHSRR